MLFVSCQRSPRALALVAIRASKACTRHRSGGWRTHPGAVPARDKVGQTGPGFGGRAAWREAEGFGRSHTPT